MTTETRNSIIDLWGERIPHGPGQEWPVRVDERVAKTPERWERGTYVLRSNGCGLDIGVKAGKIVGVRGLGTDRTNRGRQTCQLLASWSEKHLGQLKPLVQKYGEQKSPEPENLETALFHGPRQGSLGLLRYLHDVWLLTQQVQLCWTVLKQAAPQSLAVS